MRRYLMLLMILSVFTLVACGNTEKPEENEGNKKAVEENSNETDGSERGLKLQVLKGDKEAGVTVESNQFYSELEKVIQQNPKIGVENDFSVYVVDTYNDDEENSKLVLLGINRLPVAIKDFTFSYTLGSNDNEYVWERQPVEMKEETTGILQPNSVLPIVLPITEEQVELLRSLEEGNTVMAIDDFKFEEVK